MRDWRAMLSQQPSPTDLRWLRACRILLLVSAPIVVTFALLTEPLVPALVLSACWTALAVYFYVSPPWRSAPRDHD